MQRTKFLRDNREYFYYVDLHGRLYLDDDAESAELSAVRTRPKVFNIATCLKEPKFLDFFFKQMRLNELETKHKAAGYGHVSPCGRELNFVRAADTAVVFSRLEHNRLFFAPTLSVEYEMTALTISDTGRSIAHVEHDPQIAYRVPCISLFLSSYF